MWRAQCNIGMLKKIIKMWKYLFVFDKFMSFNNSIVIIYVAQPSKWCGQKIRSVRFTDNGDKIINDGTACYVIEA